MAPRRCPSEVITHRIELGTAERQQLKKFQQSYRVDKVLENVTNIAAAGLIGGGIYLGFKYGGYLIGSGLDLAGNVKNALKDLGHNIQGENPDGSPQTVTVTNSQTGVESELNNPAAGIWGVGWLFQQGMQIGQSIPNPVTRTASGDIQWSAQDWTY
jgi:hypothetical protein